MSYIDPNPALSRAAIFALRLAAQRTSGRLHPFPPELTSERRWDVEDELRAAGCVAGRRGAITPKGYRVLNQIDQLLTAPAIAV